MNPIKEKARLLWKKLPISKRIELTKTIPDVLYYHYRFVTGEQIKEVYLNRNKDV